MYYWEDGWNIIPRAHKKKASAGQQRELDSRYNYDFRDSVMVRQLKRPRIVSVNNAVTWDIGATPHCGSKSLGQVWSGLKWLYSVLFFSWLIVIWKCGPESTWPIVASGKKAGKERRVFQAHYHASEKEAGPAHGSWNRLLLECQ